MEPASVAFCYINCTEYAVLCFLQPAWFWSYLRFYHSWSSWSSWSRCELVDVPFTLKLLHIVKFLLHGKQLLYKFLPKICWGLLCLLQGFVAQDIIHSYQTMPCCNSVQSRLPLVTKLIKVGSFWMSSRIPHIGKKHPLHQGCRYVQTPHSQEAKLSIDFLRNN